MDHSDKVQQCIETLCIGGCDAVRTVIRNLEQGLQVPQADGLEPDERAAVLAELKSIMAVYDRR